MNQNYKIPNRIRNLITVDFLKVFKDKLDDIFNITEEETAWQCYYHLESTYGFYEALYYACDNHHYPHMGVGIKNYSKTLDWYDSDLFDDGLIGLMIKYELIENGTEEQYISGYEDGLEDGATYELIQCGEGSGCKFYRKKICLIKL